MLVPARGPGVATPPETPHDGRRPIVSAFRGVERRAESAAELISPRDILSVGAAEFSEHHQRAIDVGTPGRALDVAFVRTGLRMARWQRRALQLRTLVPAREVWLR
jgi:hypothetical protein